MNHYPQWPGLSKKGQPLDLLPLFVWIITGICVAILIVCCFFPAYEWFLTIDAIGQVFVSMAFFSVLGFVLIKIAKR